MLDAACPDCGSEVSGEPVFGLCPACLMGVAMEVEPILDGQDTVCVSEDTSSDFSEGSNPAGTIFGNYELLGEIARGGMGVVYKAKQQSLDRLIALKMIRSGRFASRDDVQRFHAEAAAAAKLDHPNIVPIYDVGEVDGQNYFSMAYVEGQSLAERIVAGPMSATEAAVVVRQIAEATSYAHSQNVIHRDLKPANVLLDKASKVRVTDFGLAKLTGQDTTLTATGQVLGTPSFMPPEQASGQHGDISYTSDVYSMGAILYATCTGRPPFQAATAYDTIEQVINQEVVSPRTLNPSISRDLETICLKCLEKDSRRRYQTAQELGNDLTRFINHEPITAKPVTNIDRLIKWCKRRPALATMSAMTIVMSIATLLISVIGFATVSFQIERQKRATVEAVQAQGRAEAAQVLADEEARQALAAREEAELARLRAQSLSYNLTLSKVSQLRDRHPGPARKMLDDPQLCPEYLREDEFAWSYLWQTVSRSQFVLEGDSPVMSSAISASAKWLLTGHADGSVRRWNLAEGELAGIARDHDTACQCIAISPIGEGFATGSKGGVVHFYRGESLDAERNTYTVAAEENRPITAIRFTPDGNQLAWAVGKSEGSSHLAFWDVDDEASLEPFQPVGFGQMGIHRFLFKATGHTLFTIGRGREVQEWDLEDRMLIRTFRGHEASVTDIALGIQGQLFSSSMDKTVKVWDLTSGECTITLEGHSDVVRDIELTWDENLITCGDDGVIAYWDLEQQKRIGIEKEHTSARSIVLSEDRHRLVTGGKDGTSCVWLTDDLLNEGRSGIEPVEAVISSKSPVRCIGFQKENHIYAITEDAAAGGKRDAAIIDNGRIGLPPGSRARCFPAHDMLVSSCSGTTTMRRFSTGQVLLELDSFRASRVTPDWSPAHNLLAYQRRDGRVYIRNLDDQSEDVVDEITNPDTTAMRFHPEKRWIAIGNGFGDVYEWNIDVNPSYQRLQGHSSAVTDLAFSRNGQWLASSGRDNAVSVWKLHDLPAGESQALSGIGFSYPRNKGTRSRERHGWLLQSRILGQTDDVETVAFSPNGKTLATGSADGQIRLWDPLGGYERVRIPVNPDIGPVTAISFSPNGDAMAVGGSAGRTWLWELSR